MTRPAKLTQAAIRRAIRAAQETGAGMVRIMLDGTICIDPRPARETIVEHEQRSKWEDDPSPDASPPRRRIVL